MSFDLLAGSVVTRVAALALAAHFSATNFTKSQIKLLQS
jgi:hypothetical protein